MTFLRPTSWWAVSILILLSACGGGGSTGSTGGGGGGSTPPVPTYTIGGTVAGLVGSVTLQNNGADSLTLTTNGNFSFTTRIASGGGYAVTVSSQPSGPDCAVTGGSGTAAANVTNVSVTCTVDPATRYIPMRAERPAPVLPYAVTPAGLYVFSTKIIDRAPVQITSADMEAVAVVPEQMLSANATVTGARPATLVYRTNGATGGDHLWAVDLTGASNLTPRQIGTVAFNANGVGAPTTLPTLCGATMMLKKLDDPASAFLLLRISDDPQGICSVSLKPYLVRVIDSPTTAPRPLPAGEGTLQPIYQPDGTLAGIIGKDPVSGDLVYFADETFATSRPLFSAPAFLQGVRDGNITSASSTSWTDLVGPQTSAIITIDDGNSLVLYRVDYDGTAHLLYDLSRTIDAFVRLGTDVYVQDRDLQNMTITSIVRIPVDGSASQPVLSYPPDANCNAGDSIRGLSGTKLIVWRICWGGVQGTRSEILSLPGPALDTPSTLATYPGVLLDVSVAPDRVLVSYGSERATTILDSTGAVVLPKAPGMFMAYQGDPADSLLQVRDITGSGLNGGALYKLSLGSSAAPVLSRLSYLDGTPALLTADAAEGFGMSIAPNLVFSSFASATTNDMTSIVTDLARGRAVKVNGAGLNLQLISFLYY